MYTKNLTISFLLFFFIFSCKPAEENPIYKDASFIGTIWTTNKYCAFTDLVEYNNIFYCCFRESDGHIPSSKQNYGKIRILKSIDGVMWDNAALIEDVNYDLRDPKLEVTSDGQLMLLVGCSSFDTANKFGFRKTKVGFSNEDLTQLSELNDLQLGENGKFNQMWLWRSIWYKGYAYGVAYSVNNKPPILLKSKDGINYEEIVQFNLPSTANEAGICFRSNGNMTIIIRDNNSLGYIGESVPPYVNWEWKGSPIGVNCPTLLNVKDDIFLAFRNISSGAIPLYFSKNSINRLSFSSLYNIYANGDIGYPGLISTDEFLLFSFYINGKIHLAKIQMSKIYNRENPYSE